MKKFYIQLKKDLERIDAELNTKPQLNMSVGYPSEYIFVHPDSLLKYPYTKEIQKMMNLWRERHRKKARRV